MLGTTILTLALTLAPQQEATEVPAQSRVTREPRDPAEAFLAPYGLENFSDHYVSALSTLLRAQRKYTAANYAGAKLLLDSLWTTYPTGSLSWASLPTQPFGLNLGSPPCYYALRMLTDMTDWRLANPGHGPALRTVRLTVLLVGESNGIEPQNQADLQAGTGVLVNHELDPQLLANDYAFVRDSLRLFNEYVIAITEGKLGVETHFLHLPDLNLPVQATAPAYAGLTNASQVFASVSQEDIDATDWWWILYPSHVPEQHPDFENAEFITGGMGVGPESASPFFIIDDRWLVRKPPHLGDGPYSWVERTTYLPQWLQHEFFHHLYRTYPEFGLEDSPHQWFNLATWPADFQGRYEPDYYHESVYRRMQGATIPMVAALRYATDDAPWDTLELADVMGSYERMPILNNWHIGSIQLGPQLEWQNQAGVDWNLQADLSNGSLLTGPDCPYFGVPGGDKFNVVLERDTLGDFLTAPRGFAFLGELYERTGP